MLRKYLLLLSPLLLSACMTVPNIPLPNGNTKILDNVSFNLQSCQIHADKKAQCSFTVISKYRDRIVAIGNGASLQDNLGESYSAAVRFGTGTWQKTLIADTPYEMNLTIENLSTRATSIRAAILNRIDISLGPQGPRTYHHSVTFSHPQMIMTKQPQTSMPVTRAHPPQTLQPQTTPQQIESHFEIGIDRPMNDIAMHKLEQADAKLCYKKCQEDMRCKAWTYVRPGVQGPFANCWLKDTVPMAIRNNDTISGIMHR